MDQGELRLRKFDKADVGTVRADDKVKLYSEYYDQVFTVEVTHRHGEELGGDIVDIPDEDPMLGKGDIIHFRPAHVLEILPKSSLAG